MTLVTSGAISLGGSATNRSVNVELGRSATAQLSMNDAIARTLAGVASGAISLSSFYGKSNSLVDGAFNPNLNGSANAVAVQSDGKVLVGGAFTTVGGASQPRLARLNTDGSLDTGFAPTVNGTVFAVAVQSNGKILIGGGFSTVNGSTRQGVARLNADGSLDTGFAPFIATGTPYGGIVVDALALQSDGSILMGGGFAVSDFSFTESRGNIARLLTNGNLDTGFFAEANDRVFAIAVLPDGRVSIGGSFTSVNGNGYVTYHAALSSTGLIDAVIEPNNVVFAIANQSDGKQLVGGAFTLAAGYSRSRLARVLPNSSYGADTGYAPTPNDTVRSMALQADGKLILGGDFTTVNGAARSYVARLNTNGTTDTGWAVPANNAVVSIAVQTDGKILVAGSFTTLDGITRNRLARINP